MKSAGGKVGLGLKCACSCRQTAHTLADHASRFADEFQPAGGLKRMRIKGADFGHPANVERYHQAVAGDAGSDDAGAFGSVAVMSVVTTLPSVRKRR